MASHGGVDFDVFSFEHVLLAEVSNKTRHPRASVPELQAILRPTDAASHQQDKNVSHWWEAQLLHYGLKPSKTKAVAKTRLLDALNSNTLAVPAEISKLEGLLKKSWNKSEKERRGGQDSMTAAGGPKRKRNQEDEVEKPKPVKKSKATTTKTQQLAEAKAQPKVTKSSTAAKAKASKTAPEETTATKPARTKQTARCSRGGGVVSSPRGTPSESIPETTPHRPRTKMTAKRSKPYIHPGRGGYVGAVSSRTPDSWDDEQIIKGETNGDSDVEMKDVGSPQRFPTSLGLINGTYEIDCPGLEEWDYTSDDFSLILCLDGDSVWGAYDFGMFSGILHLPQRPYIASDEEIPFQWRGRNTSEGEMSFGSMNVGWIKFLGGGRISGMINCYSHAVFEGIRISGNETRSERSSWSMRQEWDGYNQREYDRENRARWGGF